MKDVTDRQLLAIELLLNGHSITRICEALRLSRETLHQWQRQPAFQHALEAQRADRQAAFRERWHRMSGKVNDALESALEVGSPETRLKAVALWLKHQAPTPEPMPPLDATPAVIEQAREE